MKHLTAISITLSVITILVICYFNIFCGCCESDGNILVSVLSILVTVLIGWQIFQVIDFDRRVKKVSIETAEKTAKETAINIAKLFSLITNALSEKQSIDSLIKEKEKNENEIITRFKNLYFNYYLAISYKEGISDKIIDAQINQLKKFIDCFEIKHQELHTQIVEYINSLINKNY